ncbi:L-asparaginase 2 [Vibrio salinus]|uniref:L-asparaginase 2 n=1 Tax=Vibrio salinus TaxID=2899784 RepID=UPI001E464200|nr:L-asparaginase 2 [Vibrio salinus]MCE0494857.1 L-asparaginase 2 [Vibrio salinus]MCE0496121.1 L-asparaginase 2 [Vibrio salinus]
MLKTSLGKSLLLSSICFSCFTTAGELPNIAILATGGTIAGAGQSATDSSYTAGKVGVEQLVAAVPEIEKLANITGEQVVSIGSQDMNDEVWLKLAKRVNALLKRDDIDGVVITHGTDTMEETAYFLDLTIKSDKPVVLVGSMRPSTAKSADGPMNLYNAVVTATDKDSYGQGVVVAMNDAVFDARDVTKSNTTSVQTFKSPNYGPIGYIHNSDVQYDRAPRHRHTTQTPFDVSKINHLPKVGIVYNYANASALPVQAYTQSKFDGIVSAGVGNGNMYHTVFDALEKASKNGIVVVRSSRTGSGSTTLHAEVNDDKYGFVASGTLNPQKARILLMLSLLETKNYKVIQKNFSLY